MFAKYLVIFGVAGAVPSKLSVFGPKLRSAALAAAFGHTAVQTTNPGFNAGRFACNELNTAAPMDSLAVPNVGMARELCNAPRTHQVSDGLLLTGHAFIIKRLARKGPNPYQLLGAQKEKFRNSFWNFSVRNGLNYKMVGEIDASWNLVYDDILLMYQNLTKLLRQYSPHIMI